MNQHKFIVDENLLGLARQLRMIGIDCLVFFATADELIEREAKNTGRLILTKDRAFFQKLNSENGYYVIENDPKSQTLEVVKHFHLSGEFHPLSRCLRCNSEIEKIEKDQVKDLVLEKTWNIYSTFYQCPTCKKVFWEGSHFTKMQNEVKHILEVATDA